MVKFGYDPDDPRSWSSKPVPKRLIDVLAQAPLLNEEEIRSRAARRTTLSPSEKKCLWLVAKGLTNKEIAKKLYLSADTVDVHVKRAMHVLRARNRTDAVAKAIEKKQIGKVNDVD